MNYSRSVMGAILAGGRSSRMGADKALMEVRGKPMIRHSADVLHSLFERVIVVSDKMAYGPLLDLPVVPDIYKDSGPLAGIHAALESASHLPVFVLPCDMPLFPRDAIDHILRFESSAPARVLFAGDRLFPLCGLYSQTALPVIMDCLQQRILRMTDVLGRLKADFVTIPREFHVGEEAFLNINTPADRVS